MFRFLLALLALSLPAHGAPMYFSDWHLRYETAAWTDFNFSGASGDTPQYNLPRAPDSLDLYLQWKGLVGGVPDGQYRITNSNPGAFNHTEIVDYDIYQLDLSFSAGSLISWAGFAVYANSFDGLSISMSGDRYRPLVDHVFSNSSPGAWEVTESSQVCFEADGSRCDVPTIPLPASGMMLTTGLLAFLITLRKSSVASGKHRHRPFRLRHSASVRECGTQNLSVT